MSLLIISFLPDNIFIDFSEAEKSHQLYGPTFTTNLSPRCDTQLLTSQLVPAHRSRSSTTQRLLACHPQILIPSRIYPILSILHLKHLNLKFLQFESCTCKDSKKVLIYFYFCHSVHIFKILSH